MGTVLRQDSLLPLRVRSLGNMLGRATWTNLGGRFGRPDRMQHRGRSMEREKDVSVASNANVTGA